LTELVCLPYQILDFLFIALNLGAFFRDCALALRNAVYFLFILAELLA